MPSRFVDASNFDALLTRRGLLGFLGALGLAPKAALAAAPKIQAQIQARRAEATFSFAWIAIGCVMPNGRHMYAITDGRRDPTMHYLNYRTRSEFDELLKRIAITLPDPVHDEPGAQLWLSPEPGGIKIGPIGR